VCLKSEKVVEQASRDEDVREEWLKNPNSRLKLSPTELINFQMFMNHNQQYAKKQNTTDVLSFDLRDDPEAPLDAEIVICRDQAMRQAQMRGHEPRMELLLYALHGLLHLIGYDDQSSQQATQMHQREDELLVKAGFPPVYHTDLLDPYADQQRDSAAAQGAK